MTVLALKLTAKGGIDVREAFIDATFAAGNPATMTLAPRGTSLYDTTYGNVAPRVGVAYRVGDESHLGYVLRAGFGIFYDLGSGRSEESPATFPLAPRRSLQNVPLRNISLSPVPFTY
jgi:hypothetical protein